MQTPLHNSLSAQNGKMRGVPARWVDPACGILTLLDPVQAEEAGTPTPLRAGTPPSCTSWEGARGSMGVPAHGFLELWAVWAWEYHEPRPPDEAGPLASPDKSSAHMLRSLTKSMRDTSPQSICRAERNPGPENNPRDPDILKHYA